MIFLALLLFLASQVSSVTQAVPYSQEYDKILLKLNGVVSCPKASIDHWICPTCLGINPKPTYIKSTGPILPWQNFGYVALWKGDNLPEAIYVVLRGTCNLPNAFQDLSVVMTPWLSASCPSCMVHAGFASGLNAILTGGLLSHVNNVRALKPGAPIVVIGHSLGGALAVLAASWFSHHNIKVTRVHTWGAPRAGNKAFATDLNSKVPTMYRVTHELDPVPLAPWTFMGFHHAATEVFYNKANTEYKVCDGSGEDPTCSIKYQRSLCLLLPDITCLANWLYHTNYLDSKMFCSAPLPPLCHAWWTDLEQVSQAEDEIVMKALGA